MALAEQLTLSVEEYLQGESSSTVKHEYFDGEVWAMVSVPVMLMFRL